MNKCLFGRGVLSIVVQNDENCGLQKVVKTRI